METSPRMERAGTTDDTMAKKKQQEDGAEGGEKKKRSPLILVGLCLALGGGGYMLGGRSAGASGGDGAAATTTTIVQLEGCHEGIDATTAEHHAIDLPAMNVNLNDGHYLRVTVSLGLCPDVVVTEEKPLVTAPAKDLIVSTLSGRSMAELADPEGREEVKEQLRDRIADAYPEQVHDIYFLEFVMQ